MMHYEDYRRRETGVDRAALDVAIERGIFPSNFATKARACGLSCPLVSSQLIASPRAQMDELVPISDEEIERLAAEHGSTSIEAGTLEDLGSERAKDKQVFAFRLGRYYVVGPMPDAATDKAMVDAHQRLLRNKAD